MAGRKPATSPASGPSLGAAADQDGRRVPDQGRSGEVVDALASADRGRGDLLRPRRLGRLPAPRTRRSRSVRATASFIACTSSTLCARATRDSTCSRPAPRPDEAAHLPRAGVSWLGGSWVEAGGGDHPWAAGGRGRRTGGAGGRRTAGERRARRRRRGRPRRGLVAAARARTAGAELSGLNWGRLPPGRRRRAAAPPLRRRGDLRRARRRRERSSSGPRRSGSRAESPTRRSRFERATSSRARPRAGSPTAFVRARAA